MVVDGMVSKGGYGGHDGLNREVGIIGILGSLGMVGGGHNRHIRLIRHNKGIGLLGCLLRLWGGCGRWGRNSVQFVHFFWCWEWGGRIFASEN